MSLSFSLLRTPHYSISECHFLLYAFRRREKRKRGRGWRTERIRRNDMLARQKEEKKDGNPDHEISVWDKKCFSAKQHQTRAVRMFLGQADRNDFSFCGRFSRSFSYFFTYPTMAENLSSSYSGLVGRSVASRVSREHHGQGRGGKEEGKTLPPRIHSEKQ